MSQFLKRDHHQTPDMTELDICFVAMQTIAINYHHYLGQIVQIYTNNMHWNLTIPIIANGHTNICLIQTN